MNITVLGVDLAKNIFQLHGVDKNGNVVLKKRLKRKTLANFIANLPVCLIGMEACIGAHYWARKFQSYGHTVKIMNPSFVKPYVKSNKNDANDSEAICEAVTRKNMRFVPIKNIEQQDIQSLHRIRTQLVEQRTATACQIRSLLVEYGIVLPIGINKIRKELPFIIEDAENNLSGTLREALNTLYEHLVSIDKKIKTYEITLQNVFKQNTDCQRICAIEGVGYLTATAVISALGTHNTFKNGRELSAC